MDSRTIRGVVKHINYLIEHIVIKSVFFMNETLRSCVRGDAVSPVFGSIPNGAGTMVEKCF